MRGPSSTRTSPASAHTTHPAEPNTSALVAFIASLIFPLAITIDALVVSIIDNHGPYILQSVAILVGGALSIVGLPATACAILCGHTALVVAKRDPSACTRRWMARASLLLGYASLVGWVVFFVLLSLGYFSVHRVNLF